MASEKSIPNETRVYRADNFAIIDRENLSPVDQKRSFTESVGRETWDVAAAKFCQGVWLPSQEFIHFNKKWAKRSFPLENNPSEEWKFPCGYWNIYPFTHTVFIHSSVRENCSRPWRGTFYRSKKGNFLELTFLTDISGKFPHSVFLQDISGKFPHSRGKNVLGAHSLPGSF